QYQGTLTSDSQTNTLHFAFQSLLLVSGPQRVTVDAHSLNGARAIYTFTFSINSNATRYVDYTGANAYISNDTVMYFVETGMVVYNGAATVAFGGITAANSGILPDVSGSRIVTVSGPELQAGSFEAGTPIIFSPAQLNFVSSLGQRPAVRVHFPTNST